MGVFWIVQMVTNRATQHIYNLLLYPLSLPLFQFNYKERNKILQEILSDVMVTVGEISVLIKVSPKRKGVLETFSSSNEQNNTYCHPNTPRDSYRYYV